MKFTLVTSGKRRETLTGATVMEYWPRIGEALKGVYGIPEYLQAEVSTSKERLFPLVNFIDTPGLVDGPLTYPYNVEEILIRLAKLADLIFILFGSSYFVILSPNIYLATAAALLKVHN